MSVVTRDEMTIQYKGKSYSCLYEVTDKGVASVSDPEMGTKRSRPGNHSPGDTTTLLLTELVVDFVDH